MARRDRPGESRVRSPLLMLAMVMLLAGRSGAAERGPSSPAEREEAVILNRLLETEPAGAEADVARQWLTAWIASVPDVSVKLCVDLVGPVATSEAPYSPQLTAQLLFSGAAFVIENPDAAADDGAVYLAALLGVLRTYEALVRRDSSARSAFLDELLDEREGGRLASYVSIAAKNCL